MMTNFDRVLKMNLDEAADFLDRIVDGKIEDSFCRLYCKDRKECEKDDAFCTKGQQELLKEYLESEYKGE